MAVRLACAAVCLSCSSRSCCCCSLAANVVFSSLRLAFSSFILFISSSMLRLTTHVFKYFVYTKGGDKRSQTHGKELRLDMATAQSLWRFVKLSIQRGHQGYTKDVRPDTCPRVVVKVGAAGVCFGTCYFPFSREGNPSQISVSLYHMISYHTTAMSARAVGTSWAFKIPNYVIVAYLSLSLRRRDTSSSLSFRACSLKATASASLPPSRLLNDSVSATAQVHACPL